MSDESLQRVLSAAVRLYAAKTEDRAHELAPFGDKPVNATEAVTAHLRDHARGRPQLLRPADVVPPRPKGLMVGSEVTVVIPGRREAASPEFHNPRRWL